MTDKENLAAWNVIDSWIADRLLESDQHVEMAAHFVRYKLLGNKGRMPENPTELIDWMVMFTRTLGEKYNLALKIHKEHIALCNRPIIMGKL